MEKFLSKEKHTPETAALGGLSFSQYKANIAAALTRCGMDKAIAKKKADACKGLYVNETTYLPEKSVVCDILSKEHAVCYTKADLKVWRDEFGMRVRA